MSNPIKVIHIKYVQLFFFRFPWWSSWASLIAQLIKNPHLQCRRPWSNYWVRKICWRRDRLPSPVFLGFPCGSAGKESACNARDLGLIPGLGRFPWRRERLPTPMFWPGEFHGLCSLCGRKELDTTEQLSLSLAG